MNIELLAIIRAVAYLGVGIFAFISRSLLGSGAAIVLLFLPVVQHYGSRDLSIKFGALTTLVVVMLIYRTVQYEGEIRRLVLIISDAAPTKKEMPRYHAKQFGKTMGVALVGALLLMVALVLHDIVTTPPAKQDNQPLPTEQPTPKPSPNPPNVVQGTPTVAVQGQVRQNPQPAENPPSGPSSGGQVRNQPAQPPIAPTHPIFNLLPVAQPAVQVVCMTVNICVPIGGQR